MNKANLKSYAPKARLDFIKAVTERANILGITATGTVPAQVRGEVAFIDGNEWPAKVAAQREQLIIRMQREGFAQTCEAVAYTWFNRFAALRYMELHDYLGHGHRALSGSTGNLPDILTHAADLAQGGADSSLPGLNASKVIEMKLAGNRDGELYRMLLVAQCNALNAAMPFLFERIDDDTELLLPDNLLRTDSVIAKLVQAIPEEDWAEVEIIGWLYQFYISEKKDQVIGKVVKSEDIPAATQLFTPNWIVQYLVQNSVGRLWLMANPGSTLASQWPYYIQPAEQTPQVQAQLDALIQTRMDEDGGSLNPETITVLDPACGSGHILVVAYDVLKAIYLERGYQARAIPRLILEKNLYGLDIDDRAAQMAGFALLMKARADDRRLFNEPPKLNVLSLQESKGLDAVELHRTFDGLTSSAATDVLVRPGFGDDDMFPGTRPQMMLSESLPKQVAAGFASPGQPDVHNIRLLIDTFAHAKTFGSLIQIPPALNALLPELSEAIQQALQSGDLYAKATAQDLSPLVTQARLLGMQFDAVIANPPYMGARYYGSQLKKLVEGCYKAAKGDLYTCFMVRNTAFANAGGIVGMVTIPNWMFLSTFVELRSWLFDEAAIETFSHNGRGVFGSDFGSCAFTFRHQALPDYEGRYKRLFDRQGSVASNEELNARFKTTSPFHASTSDFRKIPGIPVAYWVSNKVRNIFSASPSMGDMVDARQSLATADNDRFLRFWYEVRHDRIGFGIKSRQDAKASRKKWFPHQKGGDFRKWYGNHEWVVNWEKDGEEIRNFKDDDGKVKSRPQGTDYYFADCVSWSDVTSASNAFRYDGPGFIPNVIAPAIFKKEVDLRLFLLAGNNNFYNFVSKVLNPTIHFHVGYFSTLPFPEKLLTSDLSVADELVSIAKLDWDSAEVSWDFQQLPWVCKAQEYKNLASTWEAWANGVRVSIDRTKFLEEQNNRLFIEAYGLQDELSSEVPEDQITLARADREKDCQRLISYAIGCMMGRYSLDEPGLIHAHAGNVGFDAGRYATFPADADGIVPLTDERWFTDDAASRVREFMLAVWGAETQEEDMAWLAESLGNKASESPDETIRRYLADKFYKDHLQTYKKRPIYWLFSSGKHGAFQALIYLHRYTEGTLARLRAEYVVPLIAKVVSRLDMLAQDVAAASSAAARTKLQKQIEVLRKKQLELLAYDEKLRHYADMRITLDLDDGVKVNYGKFGDLLDGVKLVSGGAGDD